MKRLFFIVAAALSMASGVFAACPDHKIWNGLLKTNVSADGAVDYDAIRVNKGGDIYEYIALLEDANLAGCGDAEKLAFWINAYNASFVRLVLARPQMKNVSEDFKMFSEKFKIAGRDLSLNDIQHRVLRGAAKNGGPIVGLSLPSFDPRLHFALVYGAVDGPRLSNRAYAPATLDAQLQAATVEFFNDPKKVRLENGKVVLPTFLRWYAADFAAAGGVPSFVAGVTDPVARADKMEIDNKLALDYPSNVDFRFDWTLNNRRP